MCNMRNVKWQRANWGFGSTGVIGLGIVSNEFIESIVQCSNWGTIKTPFYPRYQAKTNTPPHTQSVDAAIWKFLTPMPMQHRRPCTRENPCSHALSPLAFRPKNKLPQTLARRSWGWLTNRPRWGRASDSCDDEAVEITTFSRRNKDKYWHLRPHSLYSKDDIFPSAARMLALFLTQPLSIFSTPFHRAGEPTYLSQCTL